MFMVKDFNLKYPLLIILLLFLISCKILKKKKNCDCPEWSNNSDSYIKNMYDLNNPNSIKEKLY